jgi:hypothetical protein
MKSDRRKFLKQAGIAGVSLIGAGLVQSFSPDAENSKSGIGLQKRTVAI